MRPIDLSARELSEALLRISTDEVVCILDSCGADDSDSNLMIAGIEPVRIAEISLQDPDQILLEFEHHLSNPNLAAIFTISYDLGLKLEKIRTENKKLGDTREPDIFIALFDCLFVHQYDTGKSYISGNSEKLERHLGRIRSALHRTLAGDQVVPVHRPSITSNFTRAQYLLTIERIKEFIRRGVTYQVNLTQQLRIHWPESADPQRIFRRIRSEHPVPFAAFIRRPGSTVVSASPERFVRLRSGKIQASPIKGTRPRGRTPAEDESLRTELASSTKDRAENSMIVDLIRNDLGRICEFGSVRVDKLYELEAHTTLFHLVSTVIGQLREPVTVADILKAVFPCGSITGAPKIRTMQLIEEIEPSPRGLSMGAIGYFVPDGTFGIPLGFDLSVAIRTMVVRGSEAIFNVGGGIVIDSEPEKEYEETLVKAAALLAAADAGDALLNMGES